MNASARAVSAGVVSGRVVSGADKPITIAILAMGGQGGGVLADWIVSLAEAEGWMAQSTSVPGVAQRTGATIYYVELMRAKDGHAPVLSLMPTAGDVDVVLASEFMEAGRSMLRGLVTPERTTLIASTHRAYAVGEKEVPGDGTGDPEAVVTASDVAARHSIAFDMQRLAEENGSVISSVLFGALAGAGVLPFSRAAFEAAVASGGRGVEASLRAFGAGFARAAEGASDPVARAPGKDLPAPPASVGVPALDALLARIHGLPEPLRPMLYAGVRRVVDYQDPAYGAKYLDRMAKLIASDEAAGGGQAGHAFSLAAAKYLAGAMAYDDVIRVADLKTRASRFDRVRRELAAADEQIVYTTEFMHPRMDEVVASLPVGLGRFLENRPRLFAALDRLVNRGRRVKTGNIGWFVTLYVLAGLRPRRRGLLRHGREMAHIEAWLGLAEAVLPRDYALATEILACRRLVKGYSDTHARGLSKFDRVLAAVPTVADLPDAAGWLRRLRQAALMDEKGEALEGALRTIASLRDDAEIRTGG
ncbi:indolepyruvate ferredoxin oxidoreductase beta subunit [Amaricoccus macauensis]|uniref:Indolepyruvate ferredoxin oxidoreductase beta subunit n=1 Tax=Amaricoccus macauensis TaxID=57001 RepID=A0A840SEW7_9RHOB|nr:indolepyruvate oxidoreductase subunit beta family protein [Amaricoccus macauensis]MBB5221449.1 indolepyruvate ferredoxin oxidoreductase beta subunit [Amaricoccus macauensis]